MFNSYYIYNPSYLYTSWFKGFIIWFPAPSNLSLLWNLGSVLAICLSTQIVSGLFLSMFYFPSADFAFESVIYLSDFINGGWIVQKMHMNGASLFFACLYIHIARGLYYFSFRLVPVWFIGVIILFLVMMVAFMGYVLPWGQMSYWGATVITNLLSAIPYFGQLLVEWVWGGYSVGGPTLGRFFVLHFILPFLVFLLVLYHLTLLHVYGSSNPTGVSSYYWMVTFHEYYMFKDFVWFFVFAFVLTYLSCINPYCLVDPDNFIPANSLSTPPHIKPEWYFLFAYAILRCIPSKVGGVIALFLSILLLLAFIFFPIPSLFSLRYYFFGQQGFWLFISCFFILTWLGAKPISYPYMEVTQFITFIYFVVWFYSWFLVIISDYIMWNI